MFIPRWSDNISLVFSHILSLICWLYYIFKITYYFKYRWADCISLSYSLIISRSNSLSFAMPHIISRIGYKVVYENCIRRLGLITPLNYSSIHYSNHVALDTTLNDIFLSINTPCSNKPNVQFTQDISLFDDHRIYFCQEHKNPYIMHIAWIILAR